MAGLKVGGRPIPSPSDCTGRDVVALHAKLAVFNNVMTTVVRPVSTKTGNKSHYRAQIPSLLAVLKVCRLSRHSKRYWLNLRMKSETLLIGFSDAFHTTADP